MLYKRSQLLLCFCCMCWSSYVQVRRVEAHRTLLSAPDHASHGSRVSHLQLVYPCFTYVHTSALSKTGTLRSMFGDTVETPIPPPIETLVSTGAGSSQAICSCALWRSQTETAVCLFDRHEHSTQAKTRSYRFGSQVSRHACRWKAFLLCASATERKKLTMSQIHNASFCHGSWSICGCRDQQRSPGLGKRRQARLAMAHATTVSKAVNIQAEHITEANFREFGQVRRRFPRLVPTSNLVLRALQRWCTPVSLARRTVCRCQYTPMFRS